MTFPGRGFIPLWLAPILLASLACLALFVRYGSALRFTAALALPSAAPWLESLTAEPALEETTIAGVGRAVTADLYRPTRPRGALLLVHGLSPSGRRHPELTRLARLLAKQGQLVMVPEFEGFRTMTLGGREVDEIREALRHLGRLHSAVGIAGFSFGAGPALLAAAEVPYTRLVGSFGGYADLRHVITYITTGVHTFAGRRHVQRQEEYNRWKLLSVLTGFVEDVRERSLLQTIAERKLANPSEATGSLETTLGREGQSILALVSNRSEGAVNPLIARLPPRARDALDRLSPLAAIPRLSARLLIAHGAGDDSIPFTESLRLAEASGGRARLVILQSFHHTGPQSFWRSVSERAADGWRLVGLVDDLLT